MKYDTDNPTVFATLSAGGVMDTDGNPSEVNIVQIDFQEVAVNPAYALELIVGLRHMYQHHNHAAVREAANYWLAHVLDACAES